MITPHPLTNFEIEAYYQEEHKFNVVYSRDNLLIKLDEYSDNGTHWVALYVNDKLATYFDSVEHIPKEIKKFFDTKTIIANIFRLQAYDSTMCGYFCIGFIDFMLQVII